MSSLASLGSNYALRKVATEPPAGGSPAAQPSGVSQKSIDALVRWIPGETITLYAAIISISNTSLSKNQALAILLICLVINVGTVWSIAVHRAVQTLDPGRNWFSQFPTHVPVWEIALSSVALFAWISAIPAPGPSSSRSGMRGSAASRSSSPLSSLLSSPRS